jgi:hypothetical protein
MSSRALQNHNDVTSWWSGAQRCDIVVVVSGVVLALGDGWVYTHTTMSTQTTMSTMSALAMMPGQAGSPFGWKGPLPAPAARPSRSPAQHTRLSLAVP